MIRRRRPTHRVRSTRTKWLTRLARRGAPWLAPAWLVLGSLVVGLAGLAALRLWDAELAWLGVGCGLFCAVRAWDVQRLVRS